MAAEYEGIDLAPYVGWYVICQGKNCTAPPRVMGRIIKNRLGAYVLLYGAEVSPTIDGSRPIYLKRTRKPKTRDRSTMRITTGMNWAGGRVDDSATKETEIPLTERVQCRCGWTMSLHRLAETDLRRPVSRD